MSHYKPYPAYRESGVEWIGEIPEHWQFCKVAWDMKMTIGWTPPTGNRSYYGGPHNWVSIADLSAGRISETKQTLTDAAISEMRGSQAPTGSLLFSYKLSIGEVALLEKPAYTNEAIAAFHPCKRVYMPFWKYAAPVILPRYSRMNIYGSDLLNQELMNSARMVIPDVTEQQAIANSLDRETTRIDALITKKTRFIELLKEKRHALITHAVTKGLDPDVPMRDSGVEWIGEVPEHWAVCKLSYRYSVELGKMLDEKRITGDHLVPYLRNKDVQWGGINFTDLPQMDITPGELDRYLIRNGDMLVCEGGDVGRAAIWRGEDNQIGYQKALHRLRPVSATRDLTEFFYLALMSAKNNAVFEEAGSKSTISHLPAEKFREYRFAFPPISEQEEIERKVKSLTDRIDLLAEKTQRSIDLLKERRSALITAAVTGQIDLRESV
jgi:type I restriction enzyme S subunit